MRRILAILLLGSLFVMPAIMGCYETTYDEESNPSRPPDQQVAEPEGEAAPEAPVEEGSGE